MSLHRQRIIICPPPRWLILNSSHFYWTFNCLCNCPLCKWYSWKRHKEAMSVQLVFLSWYGSILQFKGLNLLGHNRAHRVRFLINPAGWVNLQPHVYWMTLLVQQICNLILFTELSTIQHSWNQWAHQSSVATKKDQLSSHYKNYTSVEWHHIKSKCFLFVFVFLCTSCKHVLTLHLSMWVYNHTISSIHMTYTLKRVLLLCNITAKVCVKGYIYVFLCAWGNPNTCSCQHGLHWNLKYH